jgi:hypothetical protein
MNDPRESMEGAPPLGGSPGRYSMFRNGCRPARPAGTTVSIPSYRRPNGHPLGSVLRQKQNDSENRLAYYGRSSRARESFNPVSGREALPRRRQPALPPPAEVWVGSRSRSGDKP